MVLSSETEEDNSSPHPYWYGRVIGVFHANIVHRGPLSHTLEPQHMEFLFIRWYGRDLSWNSGWKARRLHRVGFIPVDDDGAFGFINPDHVIRAVHLIPAFSLGRTEHLMSPSAIARSPNENNSDWQMYYVGMFADRDHVMRFRGGGVGHKSTRTATNSFKSDRDKLDLERRQARFEDSDDSEVELDEESREFLVVDLDEEENGSSKSDTESEEEEENSREVFEDDEFGPDDDGGVLLDNDMEEFGYAPL